MKWITAEDLYPMRVNPLNFTKGDVVKKIYMDNIKTPYVGVVTSVIPSTNKVEVQWPHGMGMEDPWDLVKVNPLINPPVVKQDKAYKTYQNQKAQRYNEDHCEKLKHYNVLQDYVNEKVMPLMMMSANLYNEGCTKREAFQKLKTSSENKNLLLNVINKIYDDSINFKRSNLIDIQGEPKEAEVSIIGDSDRGYKVSYSIGKNSESKYFESYKKALDTFKQYESILVSLDDKKDYSEIVAKVANNLKRGEQLEEFDKVLAETIDSNEEAIVANENQVKVGSAQNHIINAKLENLDATFDNLMSLLNGNE